MFVQATRPPGRHRCTVPLEPTAAQSAGLEGLLAQSHPVGWDTPGAARAQVHSERGGEAILPAQRVREEGGGDHSQSSFAKASLMDSDFR
ncbi:uncharacterized protein PG986_009762 [Apiospora aurea]|uniref:Uncharacterized protein n=1 Tax=Apiospora aurea TaxID=335848 RepID=A0ABR1Q8L5_9PEZI